jgi:hypothetical protein
MTRKLPQVPILWGMKSDFIGLIGILTEELAEMILELAQLLG